MAVDSAWASFEHKYISELISIEEKARQFVVDAIQYEQRLTHWEAQFANDEGLLDYRSMAKREVCNLVGSIAKLNSRSNVRGKGRDDLSADILFAAQSAMRSCAKGGQESFEGEAVAAARILAAGVVESFDAMRTYLREINKCLERVDPHLCNNAGLASRLVNWEQSWEIGAKFLLHQPLLHAFCDTVAAVRGAQRLAPALVDMCNDCDVELFMVLPRIIWLQFLVAPMRMRELLKTLLPHRFGEGDHTNPWDARLAACIDKFRAVEVTLCGTSSSSSDRSSVHPKAWEILVKRVVSGESDEAAYGHLTPSPGNADKEDWMCSAPACRKPSWNRSSGQYCSRACRDGPQQAILTPRSRKGGETVVEELLHMLEGNSFELQRHRAEDWNLFVTILLQCLSGESKQKQDPFRC